MAWLFISELKESQNFIEIYFNKVGYGEPVSRSPFRNDLDLHATPVPDRPSGVVMMESRPGYTRSLGGSELIQVGSKAL
jgi:hypothetical protein